MSTDGSDTRPTPGLASDLVAGLESFRRDRASGRLDRHRNRITTMTLLDERCPACGDQLVRSSRWGTYCTNSAGGCRYSWEPSDDHQPREDN